MDWMKCNGKSHEIAFLFTLSINQINDQFFLERCNAMRIGFAYDYSCEYGCNVQMLVWI